MLGYSCAPCREADVLFPVFHIGYFMFLPLSLKQSSPNLSFFFFHFADFVKGYLPSSFSNHSSFYFHPYHITEISPAKHGVWHNLLELLFFLASMAAPSPGVSTPLLNPQFPLPTPRPQSFPQMLLSSFILMSLRWAHSPWAT